MKFTVTIKGFENQTIEVLSTRLFTKNQLLVNGVEAPKGAKRGDMLLTDKNGKEKIARWISQFPDVPKLEVGNETIDIVETMRWHEWGWCALPALLIWAGYGWKGFLLGSVLGLVGMVTNMQLFRMNEKNLPRYGLTLLVTLAMTIIFSVVAESFFV